MEGEWLLAVVGKATNCTVVAEWRYYQAETRKT